MSKKSPAKNGSRWRRNLIRVLVALLVTMVIAVAAGMIWALTGVMGAEPGPLRQVKSNPNIAITQTNHSVVMTPSTGSAEVGLVFIPGAKVDANAYLAVLSGVVEDGEVAVVVTKPILNLAFFDQRDLSTFTDDVPAVMDWYVGGHSLGGVRACQYAEDGQVRGLVLFASYCANDLSSSSLRVLSISGSRDGLSTPEKIENSSELLPPGTEFVEIAGANHASFGNYGVQPGDGNATISHQETRELITEQLNAFLHPG